MVFRRIGFGLILAAFVGLLVFFYFKFQEKKVVNDDYFQAVPYQSVWVMDVKQPLALFSNLEQGNIIMQDLLEADVWSNAYRHMSVIDSIISLHQELFLPFENTSMVISWVPTGANENGFLFSVKIPKASSKNAIKQLFLDQFVSGTPELIKTYDGAEIWQSTISDSSKALFTAFYKGYLVASESSMLIEDAIRQLNAEMSIKADPEFANVMETAGDKRMINFFVNTSRLHASLDHLVDNLHMGGYNNLKNISGWMALDPMIKPSSALFSGYSYSSDTLGNYLKVLEGQSEGNAEVLSVLPANTSFFVHYSISNFQTFRKKYVRYLTNINQMENYTKRLAKFQFDSLKSPDEIFNLLIGSEICFAVLEIPSEVSQETISAIGDRSIGILRMRDQEKGMEVLMDFVKKESDVDTDSEYRDIEIFELDADGLLAAYFGDLFHPLQNRYCANINGYAVFADRKSTIRDMINGFKGEKTIDKDVHFQAFRENLSSTSHMMVYSNVARSPYLLSYFLNRKSSEYIESQLHLFRKFDGLAVQITVDERDRFYYNIFLSRNPIYKQISASLWEIPLDTAPAISPQFFTNHYTKTEDVFIQDLNNKIYLLSNTGRVLWTRQLDARILGGIQKADRYKNEKFQILFNTADKIYLLDRNGKDVESFPVQLKNGASLPLSLMDYDNNRKYRILVSDTLGGIRCFSIEGKLVKGWNYNGKSPLVSKLRYLQINRKDYIIGLLEDGTVAVLNRKGEKRIKIKSQLFKGLNASVSIEKGADLKSSYIVSADTLGNVIRISLDDKVDQLQMNGASGSQTFRYADVDLDGKRDYILQTEKRLQVFDQDKNSILIFTSNDSLGQGIQVYKVGEESSLLAMNSTVAGKIYLISGDGSRMEGSPFFGGNPASVADINLDGRLELITTSREGMVYCYVLNN